MGGVVKTQKILRRMQLNFLQAINRLELKIDPKI